MKNITTIIYRILKTLEENMGNESFDPYYISASYLKIDTDKWEQILINLQEDGYIKGIVYTRDMTNKYAHIVEPIYPVITIKGIEYLEDNSLMKKSAEFVKSIGVIIGKV